MRHEYYLIVAGLSLATSACMAALPIIAPQTVLAPFLIVNWTLFILTGSLLLRRVKVADLTLKQSQTWDRLFAAVLVAFTVAGWIAVSSGNPMFEGGGSVRDAISAIQRVDVADRSRT